MSTTEALNILEQVRRRFTGTGDDHEAIRTALAVIRAAIEPPPAPEKKNERGP